MSMKLNKEWNVFRRKVPLCNGVNTTPLLCGTQHILRFRPLGGCLQPTRVEQYDVFAVMHESVSWDMAQICYEDIILSALYVPLDIASCDRSGEEAQMWQYFLNVIFFSTHAKFITWLQFHECKYDFYDFCAIWSNFLLVDFIVGMGAMNTVCSIKDLCIVTKKRWQN